MELGETPGLVSSDHPTVIAGRGRVLVVDDEPTVLRLLSKTLERAGYHPVTASDGWEAARILSRESFDVVVSDITMPNMSGVELLRTVRERDLDLPVILLTGSPTVDTATRAIELGVLGYLIKPLDLRGLVDMVARAVQLYRLARVKREALEYLNASPGWIGDRAGLEVCFNRALQTITMAYQPIVSWVERRTVGFEALVRPAHAALPHPDALINAAQRLGRAHELGRRLRDMVAEDLAVSGELAAIFVNVHGFDLTDDRLYSRDAPLSQLANRVVLEITERAPVDGLADLGERIAHLRALGFRIALDDLGAGYSGLTMFAQLRPEIVKVDMSLIRHADSDATRKRLVRSMLDLCGDMAIQVVCEGIETVAERDALTEIGADLFQGYLFARPGRPFPAPRFG
jgi:EAL domain-containing protein (putative c-di-GMP-specific phosphodiesterase class I)/ActR/RegA family two-component response regulator